MTHAAALAPTPPVPRRAWLAALGLAAAVLVVELAVIRPPTLVHDWHGWRQADTQSIAQRYHREGIDLLHPRVRWGADGGGVVESELQLLPAAVAGLMAVFGEAEWLGRAVSGLAVALTSLLLFGWLAPRRGALPALAAQAVFCTSRGAVFLVSMQPDALGLCLVVASWVATAIWLESDRAAHAVAASALMAAGCLVKPTFLAMGLARAVLVARRAPERLQRALPWALAAVELALVVGWLRWGAHLHEVYGNTFGVISGGDSKFPTLARLASPTQYLRLAQVGLVFGPGVVGTAALAVAAWRRRLDAELAGVWLAYALTGVVAMRYMTESWLGSHYHAMGLVAGALSVAAALEGLPARRPAHSVLAGACALSLALGVYARRHDADGWADREIAAARALRALRPVDDGSRVIVRSNVGSQVDHWGGVNNFEDPRVFYLADATGWVLPSDRWDVAELERLRRAGAAWLVDPTDALDEHPDVAAWVGQHALRSAPIKGGGLVVSLRPATGP